VKVICPSCDITIHHPTVNKAGRVHCQNCDFSFSLFKSTAAPSVGASHATETAEKPATPEVPELGAPIHGASYGMLRTMTWVLLVGMFAGNILGVYHEYQQSAANAAASAKMGLPANTKILISFANIVRDLIVGLGLLAVAQMLARIDDLSAWLGWRSGGVTHLPESNKSSSLHYILPLCVAGGFVSISALLFGSMGEDFADSFDLSPTILAAWMLLFGVVLFMSGLGFGDLHQFFERMSALGRGIRLRKRGEEVSLGDPLRPSPPLPTNSPVYLLMATAALAVVFVLGTYALKSSIAQLTGVLWQAILLFIGVSALVIVGGAYSMYRLALSWRGTLEAWEWAAASVPLHQRENRRRGTSRAGLPGFSLFAYMLVFVQVTLTLFGYALLPLKTPFEIKILIVGGVAFSILFLLWIATLRNDVFRFRNALQVCANAGGMRSTSGALPWSLYALAMLYLAGLVILAWFTINMILPLCNEKEDYVWPVGAGLGFAVLAGYAVMPLLWLGLTLRDFTSARTALGELREKVDG